MGREAVGRPNRHIHRADRGADRLCRGRSDRQGLSQLLQSQPQVRWLRWSTWAGYRAQSRVSGPEGFRHVPGGHRRGDQDSTGPDRLGILRAGTAGRVGPLGPSKRLSTVSTLRTASGATPSPLKKGSRSSPQSSTSSWRAGPLVRGLPISTMTLPFIRTASGRGTLGPPLPPHHLSPYIGVPTSEAIRPRSVPGVLRCD